MATARIVPVLQPKSATKLGTLFAPIHAEPSALELKVVQAALPYLSAHAGSLDLHGAYQALSFNNRYELRQV